MPETQAASESGRCRWCGRPEDRPVRVVSRHMTSTGLVIYARCQCGLLRVWHIPVSVETAAVLAHAAHPAPA